MHTRVEDSLPFYEAQQRFTNTIPQIQPTPAPPKQVYLTFFYRRAISHAKGAS